MSELLAFTIAGIVGGAIYAVASLGLVVTYTTSGIFNIAHGGIGMLMAFSYWELRVNRSWPAPVALLVVVGILAPALGAFIERTLIRPMRGSSVATSLVVTVGLMVALLGAAGSIWDPGRARTMPEMFQGSGIRLGDVTVTAHELITILTGALVAIGLWLFLSRTRTGIAMRAVVDDRALLGLTGARPHRVGSLSWAMGSSLAAIAGILVAPIVSMNITILTLLVVNAYAAAMAGRLRSLPLTFAGAMVLGLIESYTIGYVTLEGWLIGLKAAIPTLFLFALLWFMPEARLRAGRVVGATTPRVPSVAAAGASSVAFVIVAMIVATTLGAADLVRVGRGLSFAIIMLSLVPLVGYGGQVSLCQMSFAGLGAFAMAKTGGDGNLVGLIAAAVLAGGVGALVALPAMKLQGLYLALATMAFAQLMDSMVFPNEFGNLGALPVGRLDLPWVSFDGEQSYFVLLAIAFVLFGMLVLWIRRGPFGRLLTAMRDSPAACATLGLSLTRTKLAVFSLSAAMAGVGGALYGGLKGDAGSTDFIMFESLPILLLAVIGGITTVSGSFIGGMSYTLLPLLQDKVPSISSLTPLTVGLAAMTVGRNPNGIAAIVAQRTRGVLFFRRRRPAATPPSPEPEPEEVSGVAAAAG